MIASYTHLSEITAALVQTLSLGKVGSPLSCRPWGRSLYEYECCVYRYHRKRLRPNWLGSAFCGRFSCPPGFDLLPGASDSGCSRFERSVDRKSHAARTVSSVFYRWRSCGSLLRGTADFSANAGVPAG